MNPGSTTSLPHPLPPGFTLTGAAPPLPIAVLDVVSATALNPKALHKAELQRSEVVPITQAVVNQALPTIVRPLLISGALRPGATVTVVAVDLTRTHHNALFILQGPGLRAQRVVQVTSGLAAGVVHLPYTLSHGNWALGAEDLSRIQVIPRHKPTGMVLLDLAIFSV
jgi:hypothetical protein